MNNFHFFQFRAETELHILYLKQIGDDESNSCSILHQRRHWWHRRERSLPQRCRISPAVRRAAYHHLLNNGKCTERELTNVWRSLLCRSEMNEAVLSLRSVAGFQPRSSTTPPSSCQSRRPPSAWVVDARWARGVSASSFWLHGAESDFKYRALFIKLTTVIFSQTPLHCRYEIWFWAAQKVWKST